MAKATFNLNKFRSQILTGSLARNNRFEVEVIPPSFLRSYGERVSLLVEQASFPLLNIASKSFKIFGPSYQRPFTSEYGGEGIPVTFHVDRNMVVKKFFDDWVHAIVNPVTFTTGYQNDYIGTITIKQLDEQDNITYAVRLEEAFPRNLNLMDLNHQASNQTHRLNVLFAYRYWKQVDQTTQVTPTNVPRAVVAPQIPTFDARLLETNNPTKQFNWATGELGETPGSYLPPSA